LIAVISDIHGNYEALRAVLREIDRLGAQHVICLGDILGYGPEPILCVDAVRKRCAVTLCGNHDYAVVYGAEHFNTAARTSLQYHRELIMPRPDKRSDQHKRRERWEFLKSLPYRYVEGEYLFVHAAPRNPVVEYLRKIDVQLGLKDKISQNFAEVDWLAFNGHTHQAGIITAEMEWLDPQQIDGVYRPNFQQKAMINVGSVGQPRDGDPRACFVTIEDALIRYHRVVYDVEKVARQIEAMPALDYSLAERLRQGR